jgi:hypothetical protein
LGFWWSENQPQLLIEMSPEPEKYAQQHSEQLHFVDPDSTPAGK